MSEVGPCATWVTHDLSTFKDNVDLFASGSHSTVFSSGELSRGTSFFSMMVFTIPELYIPVDNTITVEVTWDGTGHNEGTGHNAFVVNTLEFNDIAEAGATDDGNQLIGSSNATYTVVGSDDVTTFDLGPGVYTGGLSGYQDVWDDDVLVKGYRYLYFMVPWGGDSQIKQIRTKNNCVDLVPTPGTGISEGSEGLGMLGAGSGTGAKKRRRTPAATSGLHYLAVEVSYGSRWININDGDIYKIGAESRDSTAKTWRKVTAESPILGGNYLIHAVPEMVSEQLSIWVYGQNQTDLSDNLFGLTDLFEQYDFRIRWTFDEYREYWRCQLADATMSRGQVWTHSLMAKAEIVVPRYPDVTRERI